MIEELRLLTGGARVDAGWMQGGAYNVKDWFAKD